MNTEHRLWSKSCEDLKINCHLDFFMKDGHLVYGHCHLLFIYLINKHYNLHHVFLGSQELKINLQWDFFILLYDTKGRGRWNNEVYNMVLALIRGYIYKKKKKAAKTILTSSCTLTRLARNCLCSSGNALTKSACTQ